MTKAGKRFLQNQQIIVGLAEPELLRAGTKGKCQQGGGIPLLRGFKPDLQTGAGGSFGTRKLERG
ncbi:MAG: hypothetical protein DMG39_16415 [Acidobacteria bacterium]|nr:MAG: hypothetical protein DMG39_16415 [Acidobacteriota bacterium]